MPSENTDPRSGAVLLGLCHILVLLSNAVFFDSFWPIIGEPKARRAPIEPGQCPVQLAWEHNCQESWTSLAVLFLRTLPIIILCGSEHRRWGEVRQWRSNSFTSIRSVEDPFLKLIALPDMLKIAWSCHRWSQKRLWHGIRRHSCLNFIGKWRDKWYKRVWKRIGHKTKWCWGLSRITVGKDVVNA